MDSQKIAEKIMDEISDWFDGYYLSGNGYKEITEIIKKVIEENK